MDNLGMIYVAAYPEGVALLCSHCEFRVLLARMGSARMCVMPRLIEAAQMHVRAAHPPRDLRQVGGTHLPVSEGGRGAAPCCYSYGVGDHDAAEHGALVDAYDWTNYDVAPSE